MSGSTSQTYERALRINLDQKIYGTFAEIGAGQEVARVFFQSGKASQTIAKTMSAYDMVFSDEIYGKEPGGRYVCESRLVKMLDKEFHLLQKRLDPIKGNTHTFFAFADTVATGNLSRNRSHGWIGMRFQTKPGSPPNDVILHVRLLDKYRLLQQQVLATLGVNLVHCCFYQLSTPRQFILDLTSGIKQGQISIDMIKCRGPEIQHLSDLEMNLPLLQEGFSEACLFDPNGESQSISEFIFNKAIIVDRYSTRSTSEKQKTTIVRANKYFSSLFGIPSQNMASFLEITLSQLNTHFSIEEAAKQHLKEFNGIGLPVLFSNFDLYYKLKRYFRTYTKEPIGIVIRGHQIERLFDLIHYTDLEGGLLEGLGKLLDEKTKIIVEPSLKDGIQVTAGSFSPAPSLVPIYQYFRGLKQISDLDDSLI